VIGLAGVSSVVVAEVSRRATATVVAQQEELLRLAQTDELTGATRRNAALKHLAELKVLQGRTGHLATVIFCDIDRFKDVNDDYGHDAGDQVLRELTTRMRSCLREEDSVARFGGDEFVIVLHSIRSLADTERLAESLQLAVASPITLPDGRSTHVFVSMGLTLMRAGEGASEVLARADEALYLAKERGRRQIVVLT